VRFDGRFEDVDIPFSRKTGYIISTGSQLKERLAMRLKVVLEPSDEGGFTVHVPSLPGCISEGETEQEALDNIHEAIELYLEPVEDDWVLEDQAIVQEIEM
jgi:predicted RNase H-like HicB family nuclease